MSTKIQWTDVTDNILVVKGGGWWCRMISPGCANCYAAKINQSPFYGGNKLAYRGDAPEMELRMDVVNDWANQRKPKKHFVASMTDVFGDWVTQDMATAFLRGMWRAPKQTFQVLTKRPDIALERIAHWLNHDGLSELPPNIWIGTSVEDQQRADERIPYLLEIPAKVRFLSVEPMLGPVNLTRIEFKKDDCEISLNCLDGMGVVENSMSPSALIDDAPCVHWVIFGGESGPKARLCNIEWIREGVKQCQSAKVAVFVKQFGANVVDQCDECTPEHTGWAWEGSPINWETGSVALNDSKGGDMSEWPKALQVREMPTY